MEKNASRRQSEFKTQCPKEQNVVFLCLTESIGAAIPNTITVGQTRPVWVQMGPSLLSLDNELCSRFWIMLAAVLVGKRNELESAVWKERASGNSVVAHVRADINHEYLRHSLIVARGAHLLLQKQTSFLTSFFALP